MPVRARALEYEQMVTVWARLVLLAQVLGLGLWQPRRRTQRAVKGTPARVPAAHGMLMTLMSSSLQATGTTVAMASLRPIFATWCERVLAVAAATQPHAGARRIVVVTVPS